MENVPAAGFDQSLQGQTPGLSVISNSGEPSKAAVSRFEVRIQLIRVRHRCLFWMVCLFPVLTLIRSVREI